MNALILTIMLSTAVAPSVEYSCPDGVCSNAKITSDLWVKLPPEVVSEKYRTTKVIGAAAMILGLTVASAASQLTDNHYVALMGLTFAVQGGALYGLAKYEEHNSYVRYGR